MQKTYTLFLALLLSLPAIAQQKEPSQTAATPKNNFFVGGMISSIGYDVKGKTKYGSLGVSPSLLVHVGYQISERASIQVGLGYGKDVFFRNSFRRYSSDSIYVAHKMSQVKALVTPITLKITPFNPQKRLQLYANTALVPLIGSIRANSNEIRNSEFKRLYNEHIYSFNLVATAGLTVNYRFNSRFDAFIDSELVSISLHDLKKPAFDNHIPLGIGINYRL